MCEGLPQVMLNFRAAVIWSASISSMTFFIWPTMALSRSWGWDLCGLTISLRTAFNASTPGVLPWRMKYSRSLSIYTNYMYNWTNISFTNYGNIWIHFQQNTVESCFEFHKQMTFKILMQFTGICILCSSYNEPFS